MHLGDGGDTVVSANGRAYPVWANRAATTSVSLAARDIPSGVKLWERSFSWAEPRDNNRSEYFSGRSCRFADGDVLYLVDEADVLLLDGETGSEVGRIEGPHPVAKSMGWQQQVECEGRGAEGLPSRDLRRSGRAA